MPNLDQAGLLPALHELQDRLGYVPGAEIAELARKHNVSRAEIEGVIGFYHDFKRAPPGKRRLQICRAESCQAVGSDALAEQACKSLGVQFGETTADGLFTLEAVYCLGNCACSPAMMLEGELYGRMTPDKLGQLLTEG